MSKINVLDSSIYNRISAGEVVERPASVIKELVENCIDANSTFITIEIKEGGTKLIKISDNGDGIEFSDIEKAFLPHATSKISKVTDLDSINTLGFRGEALASIASVSKITLQSKVKNSEYGGKIYIEGGKFYDKTETACSDGTTIFVKDLFFNTPARLKFLKTPKQEESAITNIVSRLMFANPTIAFKYIVDDKVIYNSTTNKLEDKIFAVYGKNTLENLIYIEKSTNEYKLSGYISLPAFCKANKTYQTLLVNNRYVSNSLISVAVSNAYENFVMKGRFPIYILNLEINSQDIDVNVHPSKMEVKFRDTKPIYSLVYSTVLEFLNDNNCPVDFDIFSKKEDQVEEKEEMKKEEKPLQKITGGFSFGDLEKITNNLGNINIASPTTSKDNFSVLSSNKLESFVLNDIEKEKQKINIEENSKKSQGTNLFDSFKEINNKERIKQKTFDLDIDFKIIGTIFNTYIVIEHQNEVYFIDQHAAHERILFDKLLNDFNKDKFVTQPMLIPFTFEVNEEENLLIQKNIETFNSFGFKIEDFGYLTYKISEVPVILNSIDLNEFIFDCLNNINTVSNSNNSIKDFFAMKACKAAVKGGQKLNDSELNSLVNRIIAEKTILHCPHGRPICLKLNQTDIEKMFKRIV